MDRRTIRVKIIFTTASLAVTVGIFVYLFRFISLGEVAALIGNVDRAALLMFVTLSFGMSFFRTWRYGLLLGLSGYQPTKISLFLVVLVRNFFSDLLPARLGTLVYVFILNTRLGIPLGPATSSFALAFLFDLLAMAPLILLGAFWAAFSAEAYLLPLLAGEVAIGGMAIAIIYCLPTLCHWGLLILKGAQLKRWSVGQHLSNLLSSIKEEVIKARQSKLYTPVMMLSLLVRITKYASLYVFLYGLLRAIGYSWSDLSIPAVFLGISASEFAASLPISGIASFGVYEGTWSLVFELLGFPGNIAKLTAVSHHLFTQVYGFGLGALALILLVLPVFKKRGSGSSSTVTIPVKPAFYGKMVACALGLVVILYGFSHVPPVNGESRHARISADRPGSAEIEARKALRAEFPGHILFDSNRAGTFGIYTMRADGSEVTRIHDDPQWHEMFPDPSPDGKQIVFARSKALNKLAPSEIWLVSRDGLNPHRLATNGNFPTFSADGKRVYFERKRKQVMVVDIETGLEQELFPGQNSTFKKYQVVKPRVSMDEKIVAFTTDTPQRWYAWYAQIETKKAFRIRKGCEPVPFDCGRKIAFITNDHAKERTGISALNLANGEIVVVEDAGAPRGHEYFPSLVDNDRYLLYGACGPKEHAHETANYQIFVKKIKSGEKIQVTFDAFTNRWPKLLPKT